MSRYSNLERRIEQLEQMVRPPTIIADPVPWDLARLGRLAHLMSPGGVTTRAQLESALHEVSAQRIRLDSIESELKTQLNALPASTQ
jgi:hypothetical protein